MDRTEKIVEAVDKEALVLFSGGLDSTTLLTIAINEGYRITALTFDYGQRHFFEIEAAKKISKHFEINHIIHRVDLKKIGGSSLTDNLRVSKSRNKKHSSYIPNTYVPARNMIFLSIAVAWAEKLSISKLFIGVNEVDYGNYPDCRIDFIKSFEKTANLGTKYGRLGYGKLEILTPLISLKKSEIIKIGLGLGVDYALTSTCYNPYKNGNPCGKCDACIIRINGFEELGICDPLFPGKNL